MRRILKILSLLAAVSATVASAFAATDVSTPVTSTDTSAKIYNCIDGLERILPSDYYACRALYHFQRNHNRQAVVVLEDAAHWANKDAQYTLGLIYFNGDVADVPQNRPLGLAWLALSAERKNQIHASAYAIARTKSTPGELATAAGLWQKMLLEYGDKVAGARAMRNFDQQMKYLQALSLVGEIQLSGYSPFPQHSMSVLRYLQTLADKDFTGLKGTVTVGQLENGEH